MRENSTDWYMLLEILAMNWIGWLWPSWYRKGDLVRILWWWVHTPNWVDLPYLYPCSIISSNETKSLQCFESNGLPCPQVPRNVATPPNTSTNFICKLHSSLVKPNLWWIFPRISAVSTQWRGWVKPSPVDSSYFFWRSYSNPWTFSPLISRFYVRWLSICCHQVLSLSPYHRALPCYRRS